MKKLLSVLLTVALLLCCVSVFAETEAAETEAGVEIVPAFNFITVIPEGYEKVDETWLDPFIVSQTLKPVAEGKPAIMTLVSYNDAFSDVTFNADMTEDEFKATVDQLVLNEETGEAMPYEIQETGLGTKVVLISTPDGYMEFYSIWHGYEVSLFCANFDAEYNATPPTEEQVAVIMQFLTDMDFQAIIEEVPAT